MLYYIYTVIKRVEIIMRRKTWKSKKSFSDDVDLYFDSCELEARVPTANGLALHLTISYVRLLNFPIESKFYEYVERAIARLAVLREEKMVMSEKGSFDWLRVNQHWQFTEKQEVSSVSELKIEVVSETPTNLDCD